MGRIGRNRLQPHGRERADRTTAQRNCTTFAIVRGHRKRTAAFAQDIECLREFHRVGTFEAGVKQSFGRAVGLRGRTVAAPHDHRLASGRDERVARTRGGTCAGIGGCEQSS